MPVLDVHVDHEGRHALESSKRILPSQEPVADVIRQADMRGQGVAQLAHHVGRPEHCSLCAVIPDGGSESLRLQIRQAGSYLFDETLALVHGLRAWPGARGNEEDVLRPQF